ncbi:hypothetical protein CALCODRAFT_442242 [Calocera cornea HHB12733]|uniref:Vacuolar protein sorting-associated protein 51 homolog n=1 Tax=Calocera cornea HHB12733 TaxID=1353952 RepID=A0A165D3K9_9BASI|nr:hypothetical protein CALCODRAFT_442242 [Calocera cornea HHB12733]
MSSQQRYPSSLSRTPISAAHSPPPSPSAASFASRPATPPVKSPDGNTPARRSPLPRKVSAGGGGARDLLRKHYGLGLASANASASNFPIPGKEKDQPKIDPMDIDSPAFDAHLYYSTLISTSTLPVLLAKENELMGEIRTLDAERQSLVYNHHHELIAASDTIKAMKRRAEGLDSSLDTLKAAFSEISRLGAELSTSDRERKEGNA